MASGLGDLNLLMHEIKDCVCGSLDQAKVVYPDYPGCPCRSCVVTGGATWDVCGAEFHSEGQQDCVCGQLTVATERIYPYISNNPAIPGSFPTQQVEVPNTANCFPSGIAADLNVTILRCSSAPLDGELYVACDVMEREAWINSIDLMVLFNSVICCLSKPELNLKRKSRRYLIQQATPLLSDGMCEGAEIRFTVDLGTLCPCPDDEVSP